MTKPAKEVMLNTMFSTLVESMTKLRGKKVDMEFLRDAKMIHSNTTFSDLPPEVQNALRTGVDAMLLKLLNEGYTVGLDQQPS